MLIAKVKIIDANTIANRGIARKGSSFFEGYKIDKTINIVATKAGAIKSKNITFEKVSDLNFKKSGSLNACFAKSSSISYLRFL